MLIEWTDPSLSLVFVADEDQPVRLVGLAAGSESDPSAWSRAHQPVVEVLTPQYGNGSGSNSGRHSGTHLGEALRYVRHDTSSTDGVDRLVIEQRDPATGLTALSTFEAHASVAAVRTTTTVSVLPDHPPLTLWAVTSLTTGAVVSTDINHVVVWRGSCSWSAENRWSHQPLRSPGLAERQPTARGETCRGCLSTASTSSWSSGAFVPAGAVSNTATGQTLAWQVEHNGSWLWEVGERPAWRARLDGLPVGSPEAAGPPQEDPSHDGAYVAVLGPTDQLHQWSYPLESGSTFTTVAVTFSVGDSFDQAFARLADHRRAARRRHRQDNTLPVIFNDYMDTLEGDPTEAKLLPLIDAAAAVGCEYFCIDAGWYDDTSGWWASVGDWVPSTVRFPRGLGFVLDHIRARGLVPGLWLEPEVVGVHSEAASSLPNSAFLQRDGVRVRERDRYLLDLRSPEVRTHLDASVDRLVKELGVGYFKLDYNVTPGPGTDYDTVSVGHGLLEHNRALLTWLDGILDRHPDLVLENCGSGALRSDFAMLSRLQLQSTSDQQDPLLYPAIAVGALVHILPEQAGNWSYPQSTMDDEHIAWCMCTGLAGRLYQAGLLDRMNEAQLALVRAGVQAHKDTRHALARSSVSFPTGVPSWDSAWVTVAFSGESETYVIAWRQSDAPATVALALPALTDRELAVEQVYPPVDTVAEWSTERTPSGLTLTSGEGVAAARMLRLTPQW
ncbi:MAG TPA: glycoside hydrolase family 36 protein [Propionibacteriaceae bacterium]|nr:glycoside hydrolase family 36 protein [Propionibacteriaceae bacterium]